jgi:hypothetical protein
VTVFFPDVLLRLSGAGTPLFAEFASAIGPTELAPGKNFGSGLLTTIEYMLQMADVDGRTVNSVIIRE